MRDMPCEVPSQTIGPENCGRPFPAALNRTAAPVAFEPSEIRLPKYVTNSPAVARSDLDKVIQLTDRSRAPARNFGILLGTDLKPTIVESQDREVRFVRARVA